MTDLIFRSATAADLPALVAMLADDHLGARRERSTSPLPPSYADALAAIDAEPNHELIVACREAEIVGMLQLSFLPGLSYQGAWRAQIEGVRVAGTERGGGVGHTMVMQAIKRARARSCLLVQLTSDQSRADARRFYESLGFVASHVGMKLTLRHTDGSNA